MAEIKSGVFIGQGEGMHGPIKVEVKINEGAIQKIEVIEHSDKQGIADAGVERLPKAMVEAQSYNVDVVSGATITSKGIKDAVKDAVTQSGAGEGNFSEEVSEEEIKEKTKRPTQQLSEEIAWDKEYDVVVVGAGAAGIPAAIEAKQAGASVVVVDAAPNHLFSNTSLSEGIIIASDTSIQKEAGIEDDKKEFRKFVEAIMEEGFDPDKMDVWAEEGAGAIDFLIENGVEFSPERLEFHNEELFAHVTTPVKRGHNTPNVTGEELSNPLYASAKEKGIDFDFDTKAEHLVYNGEKVIGLMTDQGNYKANKGVIIATGGFSRNKEMTENFMKGLVETEPTSTLYNNGEGIIMGQEIGAKIGTMWNAMYNTLASQYLDDDVRVYMPTGPNIFVSTDGRRHVDEVPTNELHHQKIGQAVAAQPRHYVWSIWDQDETDKATEGKNLDIFSQVMAQSGFSEGYKEEIKQGYVLKADTIEELAEKTEVDSATLRQTIQHFNTMARNGEDTDLGRNTLLGEVKRAPFYAVKVKTTAADTAGGLLTNTNSQVLDMDNAPIEGLYAAGSTTSGWTGRYYPGSGTAIGTAIVFGRRAGQHVTK